jgi:prevent-host-death family protein
MGKTVPVREFRAELASLIDEVADRREHIVITRRGRRAAAVVPIDEYDALEETAEILSDHKMMASIDKGRRELAAGRSVSLDELRAEVAKRRRRK